MGAAFAEIFHAFGNSRVNGPALFGGVFIAGFDAARRRTLGGTTKRSCFSL